MRILRGISIVLFAVTLVVFSIFYIYQTKNHDDTKPEITIATDYIEVRCDATDEELLKGVSAVDEKDGDLTDKVVVESVSRFIKPGVCEVTYAVCDSNNHVAHATRRVGYSDYEPPKFKLTQSLCFSLYQHVNIGECIRAVDSIEGDISGNIVVTSSDYTASVTGVFNIEMTVTNGKGDTSRLKLPLIMEDRSLSAPVIKLSDYLIYVDKNQPVDFRDYIVSALSKNEENLISAVEIDDNVNFKESGIYTVHYFVTDRNGARGHSVLNVVVE